ncbi:Ubiquitin carboxyl-terminal hydrolase 2 [Wickerhamiella sorbophila]|uniref:ubiquitinyl hydrolase 1 n=1 Tax=Wickerhamiella sorbophila TaxID=45607 RepID=A0A2T0FLE3_9ASCO|nr:Ubiquitin carboxyl-terminal hydrolase 2 [Wickerhamiella sorbophila]PRT55811.1 Ubiquitin carboxyl-terminal hydrolase 2 [Wickerhamiella sorbophila]
MTGGRSSQRLIEEILCFIPHEDLVSLSPVELLTTKRAAGRSRPLMAIAPIVQEAKSDMALDALVGDSHTTLRGFFADIKWHFYATIAPPAPTNGSIDYDWHLTDKLADYDGELSLEFKCSLTGSVLGIKFWSQKLTAEEWSMFDVSEINKRFENRPETYNGDTAPTITTCLETFYTIVRNSLVQNPPRPIPFSSARASVHIDLSLLPKLGFVKNEDERVYDPPQFESDEERLYYKGLLTEISLFGLNKGGKQFGSHWPVYEVNMTSTLGHFLGCSNLPTIPSLSSKYFGSLGCTSSFTDDGIWQRYSLQVQNDARNTPHYLESLKIIAQNRDSEELQTRVMELISLGTQTLGAIEDAYDALDLDIDGSESEDQITQVFLNKLESKIFPDAAYEDLAQKISAIADHRQSQELRRLSEAMTMDYETAMKLLNANESTDNLTLFETVASRDRASLVAGYEGRIALKTIGIARQDPEILNRVETLLALEPCTSAEGYNMLGVGDAMEDKDIIAVFEVQVMEEPKSALRLRQALRAVGQSRESKYIEGYLSTSEPVVEESSNTGPVGLWNIGNTCYLNSLLQFYYTIDPLRHLLVDFDDEKAQHNDASMKKKTVGGRQVPFAEVERSQQFVKSLGGLFKSMTDTHDRYVVPEEDLAYMALVPPEEDVAAQVATAEAQAEQESIRRRAAEAAEARAKQQELSGEVETEPLESFDGMDTTSLSSTSSPISPMDEVKLDNSEVRMYDQSIPSSVEIPGMQVDVESEFSMTSPPNAETKPIHDLSTALQRQQDVTECIENVLFQIEAAVCASGSDPNGEQLDLVKDLFYGLTVQTLQNASGEGEIRKKTELFSTLMVDVADGPRDIYDALDSYFNYEVLKMSEGETIRELSAKKLPPILQIQIQRVQFDRTTGKPYKSTAPLIFGDTVYLDRYLETDDAEILSRRAKVRVLRARLSEIEEILKVHEKPLPGGDTVRGTLETCIEWLENSGLDSADETLVHLYTRRNQMLAVEQQLEAEKLELSKEIEGQFVDFKKYGYKIYALFIHRGQVSFGHYWVYIHDFATDQFYKYNDENVTAVPSTEALDMSLSNDATPYFLVFVREDFVDKLSSRISGPIVQNQSSSEVEVVDLTNSD